MMKHFKMLTICIMAVFYINVGAKHFVDPDWFLPIMPPDYPMHYAAVYVSGFFEIVGGIGVLIPRFRKIAGWGLVALLIAVYPANIYMAIYPEVFPDIPIEMLYFRLALQFLFFYWAYSVTRPVFNLESQKNL